MYCEGGDLRKQLQGQATDWNQKITINFHISLDMGNIHEAGMIHR